MNNFKNRLLISVSALSLSASVALATDLPSKQTPPPAFIPKPAKISWTGLSIGIGAGGSRADTKLNGEFNYASPYSISNSPSMKSAFADIDVGLDYQVNDNIVLGLVGNFDFRSRSQANYSLSEGKGPHYSEAVKIGDNWSVGARLGALVSPATLIYLAGGYSAADLNVDGSFDYSGGSPNRWEASSRKWSPGYFEGAGVESMITEHLSAKVEYRYSKYTGGSVSGIYESGGKSPSLYDESVTAGDIDLNTIRGSLNWRF